MQTDYVRYLPADQGVLWYYGQYSDPRPWSRIRVQAIVLG